MATTPDRLLLVVVHEVWPTRTDHYGRCAARSLAAARHVGTRCRAVTQLAKVVSAPRNNGGVGW